MLKQKTKKWLSRLGAGMLLGLSIFNLGNSFGQNNQSIPKGAGNFRRKEDTNVNPELKGMLKTVEEEAKLVISQQGRVQENSQTQQLSLGQTLLRFSVVSVWAVSLGVVFSSLVFNFPFALGKMALSALPGNAHLAVFKLTADKQTVALGENLNLKVTLDSQEKVSSAKIFLQYPREAFFLDEIVSDFSNQVNFQSDGLEIIFADLGEKEFTFADSLADISFIATDSLDAKMSTSTKIELLWDKSLVLNVAKAEEKKENILGKTINPQVSLTFDSTEKLFCQRMSGNPEGENFWQEWVSGSPTNRESNKWNQLNADWSLGCVSGENMAGLLLVGNRKVEEFFLRNKTGQKKQLSILGNWQTGETFFHIIDLTKADLGENFSEVGFSFVNGGLDFSWPNTGLAKVFLIENNNQ